MSEFPSSFSKFRFSFYQVSFCNFKISMLPLPFFQRVVLFFENNECLLLFSEFPSSFLPFFSRASLLSFCKASFFIFLGSSLPLSFRVSLFSKLGDNNVITVKPFHSKHHQDLKIVSVTERCPLHRGSSQIGSFCFKNLL